MHSFEKETDGTLLTLLQHDDERAFTAIYNRYWERMIATAYHFTKNTHQSEDVVHDVMLSLWKRRHSLNITSLPTYLATAVKFAIFKAMAKSSRQRWFDDSIEEIEDAQKIIDVLDAKFDEEYLRGIVEQLPEKARLVFLYSREENMTVKEIGERMNLSHKSIEYHMTKALTKLRSAFRKTKSFLF